MGERLLFHSTIGFAIALAWFILKGAEKLPESMSLTTKRLALFSVVGIMTLLYGAKTWERNWDWKNDITLFLKDVETMPNSVLVLGNAGARYIDLSDTKTYVSNPYDSTLTQLRDLSKKEGETEGLLDELSHTLKPKFGSIETYHVDSVDVKEFNKKRVAFLEKGLKYLKHAIELHPRYVNGYLNLGLGSYKLGRDRDALFYWKQAEKLYPNNPYLKNYYIVFYNDLLNRGYRLAQRGQLDSAVYELNKTIILDKLNPEGFYNLGGAYYQKKQYDKAKYYWEQCLKIKPDHAQAKAGLSTIVTVTVPATQAAAAGPISK
jgi:tetratricopeptide (TPR) repeat protein